MKVLLNEICILSFAIAESLRFYQTLKKKKNIYIDSSFIFNENIKLKT